MDEASLWRLVDSLWILVRTRLWLHIVVGMNLGILVGLLASPSAVGLVPETQVDSVGHWLALPGHVFLALVQMVVVLLVVSSIVLGITSSGEWTYPRHVAARIAPHFIATTTVAVAIGIGVTVVIEPGTGFDLGNLPVETSVVDGNGSTAPARLRERSLAEGIAAPIPSSPLGAMLGRSTSILLAATTIGAPSTPGVGVVVLATILEGVGVPAAGVALIFGVDHIFDMSRTAVNVSGDLLACVVMDRWLSNSHVESAGTMKSER